MRQKEGVLGAASERVGVSARVWQIYTMKSYRALPGPQEY